MDEQALRHLTREVEIGRLSRRRFTQMLIGLGLAEITQQIADQLGLSDTRGVLALSVPEAGPAYQAGIRPGDVLTKLDGDDLATPEDFLAALRTRSPGQTVAVEFRRGAETQEVKIQLVARPAS